MAGTGCRGHQEECCLLACSLLMACSACCLLLPMTTSPPVVLPTTPHSSYQSKTMPQGFATGWCDICLIWGPSSQMTIACVELTKKKKTNQHTQVSWWMPVIRALRKGEGGGAKGMTKRSKSLLCKPEDMSSNLQIPCRCQAQWLILETSVC